MTYLLSNHFPRHTNWLWRPTTTQGTSKSTHNNKIAQNKLLLNKLHASTRQWNMSWIIDTGNDSVPFQQFQVLFNSLFKVLFIFPSRYLFAIGLAPIFSFRWNLPPTLCCIPKQHDSKKTCRTRKLLRQRREYHPPCCPLPRNLSRIAALTSLL